MAGRGRDKGRKNSGTKGFVTVHNEKKDIGKEIMVFSHCPKEDCSV